MVHGYLACYLSQKRYLICSTFKEYGFQPDISMVLEVFEIAYGMEWMAEYMSEHSEEFRHY